MSELLRRLEALTKDHPERLAIACGDDTRTYGALLEDVHAYAKLSLLQRLQWLDETRRFLLLVLTPEARERQERLRRGLTITGDQDP